MKEGSLTYFLFMAFVVGMILLGVASVIRDKGKTCREGYVRDYSGNCVIGYRP